jgi:hypothetical protein
MVVEVNSDIDVGDCPPDVPTMTDGSQDVPCTDPADFVFAGMAKELGKPFPTQ